MPKKKTSSNGIVYSTDPSFANNNDHSTENEPTALEAKQPLRIRLDTKHRSGKAVTLVEGFIGKNEDLEILGKKLKTFCGTGGSVKDRQVIIQGDQRPRVLEWLKKNGYTNSK